MLSTSIICDSGGWGGMLKNGPFASPGSRMAGKSERSALVVPPSTDSGPRMPLSWCARLGNDRKFSWPGWMPKAGSATTGTGTGWYQLPVSGLVGGEGGAYVTRAAIWVTVTLAVMSVPGPPSGRPLYRTGPAGETG